jgi:hypothetical protein
MTALALGCSHTAGTGIAPSDCYVSELSRLLNQPIHNLGVPGGNHTHIQTNLVEALGHTLRPNFVVAQWPNPIRRTTYYATTARDENIQHAGAPFYELLRASEQNFYQPWISTIIVCNLLCKTAAVPIIHIMIENIDDRYHDQLAQHKIRLHVDRKTPNETWLMDSAASDKLHHSADCHRQWATRLLGLIK